MENQLTHELIVCCIICNVDPGAGASILSRTPLVVTFFAQNITVQNLRN